MIPLDGDGSRQLAQMERLLGAEGRSVWEAPARGSPQARPVGVIADGAAWIWDTANTLFRQAGWPIGSGIVEGGRKNVIGLHFRRRSARWKPPWVRTVLHLRLDLLDSRWQKRCHLLRKAA